MSTAVYFFLIVLALVFGLIAFLPRLENWRNKNNEGFDFLLTIIATLIGVFLAIALANYEEQKKEKNETIDEISVALHELTSIILEISSNKSSLEKRPSKYKRLLNSPLYPEPELSLGLIKKESVFKYLSKTTKHHMIIRNRNIKSQFYYLNLSDTNAIDKIVKLSKYLEEVNYLKILLLQEKKYQKGEISESEMAEIIKERFNL